MSLLTKEETEARVAQLSDWGLSGDGTTITKTFTFKDWREAFAFATKISEIAEQENHHPDIDVHWGRVGVALSTHSAGGLTEKDFIVAVKIDRL